MKYALNISSSQRMHTKTKSAEFTFQIFMVSKRTRIPRDLNMKFDPCYIIKGLCSKRHDTLQCLINGRGGPNSSGAGKNREN